MEKVYAGHTVSVDKEGYLTDLSQWNKDIAVEIAKEEEIELTIKYEPNVAESLFEQELNKSISKDKKLLSTTVGPHRDDFGIDINHIDIRKFGSQGQQRSAALSLKLSEIELVKSVIQDTPILLLDDVLSELDSQRQHQLLDSIHDIQTIITCTGLDEFIRNRFELNKVYQVIDGKIE